MIKKVYLFREQATGKEVVEGNSSNLLGNILLGVFSCKQWRHLSAIMAYRPPKASE
jgi:hypothetical protein